MTLSWSICALKESLAFAVLLVLIKSLLLCVDWCINFQIRELKEMSLSANQYKSEMKRMTWKVEGENGDQSSPVRGGPVDSSTFVVELGPMEIRTFLLKF